MTRFVDSFESDERRALEHERRALEHERRALERAARARGRAEAELVEAQLMRKHRARMAEMADVHAFELDLARIELEGRGRRMSRWGVALVGIWLTGVGLAAGHASGPISARVAETGMAAQVDVCGWSSTEAGELARLEQRLANPPLASYQAPIESRAPAARAKPMVATTRRAPVSRPAAQALPPPTAATIACSDDSGDPCCAFGEMIC